MSRDYAAFRMFENDVPLAPLTTLGIGGPAKFFARAESVDDVREALAFAESRALPVLVLAGGSNVLVPDEGFAGLVIHMDLRGITIESEDPESVIVNVAAGERWDDFVDFAVASGWAGVKCLSGIPGSAGATPIQNVGAYGQDVAETIRVVRAYDRRAGEVVTLAPAQCGFGYRHSAFKHDDRYVVLAVGY